MKNKNETKKNRKKENGIQIKTRIFPLFLSNAERKLINREETNCPKISKRKKIKIKATVIGNQYRYIHTNITKKSVR